MKNKTLTGILAMTIATANPSFGITAIIAPDQYASLLLNNIQQTAQAVQNVKNQVEQIKQLGEQIDLANITNDILGDYGLGDLADFEKTLDSYKELGSVEDLGSILDGIKVEDIFANTQGGAFETIEAPKVVDEAKYKPHAAVESAYKKAVETQKRVKENNVALGTEAADQREAASTAVDEATYAEHIDKAEAAEAAIERNNQEALAAVANARAVKTAADMHEKKREKAMNDRAREAAREENKSASEAFQAETIRIR